MSAGDAPETHSSYYGTTLWTLISEARAGGENAWRTLLERYREAVRKQIEKHFHDDPEGLTAEFLHVVFAQKLIPLADRPRGRFRALLADALKKFISSEWRKRYATKRGGSATDGTVASHVSIDEPDHGECADDSIAVANIGQDLDRELAWTTLNLALESVRTRYVKSAKGSEESRLDAFEMLVGKKASLATCEIAERLGMKEGAVKVARHRLREQIRAAFGRAVADTVPPAEAQEEARYLSGLLA